MSWAPWRCPGAWSACAHNWMGGASTARIKQLARALSLQDGCATQALTHPWAACAPSGMQPLTHSWAACACSGMCLCLVWGIVPAPNGMHAQAHTLSHPTLGCLRNQAACWEALGRRVPPGNEPLGMVLSPQGDTPPSKSTHPHQSVLKGDERQGDSAYTWTNSCQRPPPLCKAPFSPSPCTWVLTPLTPPPAHGCRRL